MIFQVRIKNIVLLPEATTVQANSSNNVIFQPHHRLSRLDCGPDFDRAVGLTFWLLSGLCECDWLYAWKAKSNSFYQNEPGSSRRQQIPMLFASMALCYLFSTKVEFGK